MTSNHTRETRSMRASPRCGARTRKGTECEAPAIRGKARCRMHGGRGSGAPEGNQNALKSGLYTAEALELRRYVNETLRRGRKVLRDVTE